MSLSRRDFLKASLAASTFFGLGAGRALAGPPLEAAKIKRIVSVVRGTKMDKMLTSAMQPFGGMKRFVRTGMQVVIKTNASFANAPDWGNNTSPELLTAVAKACRESGARRVLVLDYPLMRGAEALDMNGTAAAVAKLKGVELRVLGAEHEFRKVKVPGGEALHEVAIAREVLDCDLLINLPVAKAHDAVAASIGMKNLMGIIWDRAVFHTGMEIDRGIADLNRVLRPGLTIVDMTRIMVSNGPRGPGEVVTTEKLVVGIDPVAVDSVALGQARFNGRRFRPKQLRYLLHAHKAGLGEIRLGELDIRKLDA